MTYAEMIFAGIALLAVIVTLIARTDSRKAERHAKVSADGTKESIRIAAENLEIYKEDIEYARRIKLTSHLKAKKLAMPFAQVTGGGLRELLS